MPSSINGKNGAKKRCGLLFYAPSIRAGARQDW
ncbi:hypothetical protein HZS_3343 [Henneguya salminicola]|nr:hypothetical protein HZS_3343 [Henneguya salminicola]